jgi:hexosaminidase
MRWEEVWRHFGAALDQRTIIHAWLSNASLIAATSAGYRAVYSVDSDSFYFDYLDVLWSDVYDVDILAGVTNTSAIQLVLGGQACLWGETVDAASLMSVLWPRAAALAERLWTNSASKARDYDVVARFAAFRCTLLERGIPAPLPGAASAGAMRPAWTVGSCSGGYRPLC